MGKNMCKLQYHSGSSSTKKTLWNHLTSSWPKLSGMVNKYLTLFKFCVLLINENIFEKNDTKILLKDNIITKYCIFI